MRGILVPRHCRREDSRDLLRTRLSVRTGAPTDFLPGSLPADADCFSPAVRYPTTEITVSAPSLGPPAFYEIPVSSVKMMYTTTTMESNRMCVPLDGHGHPGIDSYTAVRGSGGIFNRTRPECG
ncbi:Hypothetical protein CINCED_3A015588 [Cinara cedri]|uniref:Uncharacterized protein n=1 Tax=Cinara cedri TaxID=506608 RepID=A0A5E4M649_9HEMI|nr:Hypothetical protein CINCED_3A015588 [Cinara cedri]